MWRNLSQPLKYSMPGFTENYPSLHRRVKITACRMQNTVSLSLSVKCTHAHTNKHTNLGLRVNISYQQCDRTLSHTCRVVQITE